MGNVSYSTLLSEFVLYVKIQTPPPTSYQVFPTSLAGIFQVLWEQVVLQEYLQSGGANKGGWKFIIITIISNTNIIIF